MMQADAGLSVADGGWLASANYTGTLLGALAAMRVRVPSATAIRVGLLAIGLTTLAMAFEHRLAGWIALRALAGVATAWVLVFASAWSLDRLAPLRRPVLNSMVFAGYGVGIAGAGLVCLALMQRRAGSTLAWSVLGGLALAVMAAIWPVVGVGDDAHAPEGGASQPGVGWDADAARLALCYGAFGFGYIVPATFLPVMARQAVDDPAVFGWAWPIFGLAAAAATFIAAWLSRSIANRLLWSRSHDVMAIGVLLPVLRPGIGSILVSALLVGSTFTVTTMAGFQEARLVRGTHARPLIGALASAFAVGQIVALAGVNSLVRAEHDLWRPLIVAGSLLALSSWALRASAPGR
jgi:Uncharacterised MFS-type transporter YbfB